VITRKCAAVLLVALLSVGLAACGSGGDGAQTLPEDPQGMTEVAGFHGVKSGELEVALEIDRYKPGKPEEVNMRIIGNFTGAGGDELPQISMGIESRGPLGGREIDFSGALSLLKGQADVTSGPQVYQPDKSTFEKLKSEFEEAQQEGGAGAVDACLEAAGDFSLTQVLHHVSYEGEGKALDGAKVKTVGADLDLPAAIGELIKLGEDPACRAQLEAVGIPPAPQLEQLEKQLQGSAAISRVTISLDKHGVIRYFKVLTNVELPRSEELEIELVLRLGRINEVSELPTPSGTASLGSLLKKFGVDMQALEEASIDEIFLAFLEANATGLFEGGKP
jgi:hypothetical protein